MTLASSPSVDTPPVWEDRDALVLPRLAGTVETEVCVVGLGGSGLACVRELRARGRRVVGVDAGPVAGGAAGRNGGFLLAGLADFHHDAVRAVGRERAVEIYRLTIAEIARMEAETPAHVRRLGSLRIADSAEEEADCRAQLEAMRADALPVERYAGPAGLGLRIPTDGAFQPLARARALARAAIAAGARLYGHSRVVALEQGEVVADAGRVRCETVVVAVDGMLEQLLPELVGRVRSTRLQMLATPPVPPVPAAPCPVYARWGYDYWQQLADGRVALGGARDVAGDAEWTTEAVTTARVQEALEARLRERLGVAAPVTHRWAAIVGYTPDGLPIAREVRPGVWAIGGYCGTGNVVGALLGRAVAQHVTTGASALLDPFRS